MGLLFNIFNWGDSSSSIKIVIYNNKIMVMHPIVTFMAKHFLGKYFLKQIFRMKRCLNV